MTPKEKAKDLVDKFDNAMEFYTPARYAKQCALIAVDEIIEECYNWTGGTNDGWETKRFDFWQLVKQEIINL
jgi:hypothetical protein